MLTTRLHIGIAGAGISGLIAGLELQRAGHSVTIFEARSRAGGRIYSFDLNGMVAESGPEFIHGNGKETIALLKKFNITYEVVNGKMYTAENGQLSEDDEISPGWDRLLGKMRSLHTDLPLIEFLEKNFPGDRNKELRRGAIRFAEGFDLADTGTASTLALIREWEVEEAVQYRIPSGYGILIRCLENEFVSKGGNILLNHPVSIIHRNARGIKISIYDKQDFTLDKLIVSLPFSAFNQDAPLEESVVFVPALDENKEALKPIGFGNVIKIILTWDSSFWKSRIPDAQFIFSDYFIPTWWTQFPSDLPMLTGWLGGPAALLYGDKPDDFFLDKAMESLAGIFSVSIQSLQNVLREHRIFNWKNEPWSRGAYTYSRIGFKKAKTIWRQPVDGNIYFAGEAYYDGPFPGTVEAAIVSGTETARQLLVDIR